MTTKVLEPLFWDLETSIRHGTPNPFTKSNFIVSASWAVGDEEPQFTYYRDPDFLSTLLELIPTHRSSGVNIKFDFNYLKAEGRKFQDPLEVWDCSIAEHIMSGQKSVLPGMDRMCDLYGLENKQGGLEEYWNAGISTEDIPVEIVREYNKGDIRRQREIYRKQLHDPRLQRTANLERLILADGQDLLVLSEMESNGLKYDMSTSRAMDRSLSEELGEIKEWFYGISKTKEINLSSGDHLSALLFGGSLEFSDKELVTDVFKSGPRKGEPRIFNRTVNRRVIDLPGFFNPIRGSELKKSQAEGVPKVYSTSEEILMQLKPRSKIQREILEKLKRFAFLEKVTSTYLRAFPDLIDSMEWEGYLHGQFNQTIAATGRLTSSKPNLQNTAPLADQMLITRF